MKEEIKEKQVKCDFCNKKAQPIRMLHHVFKFHRDQFDEWKAKNSS